TSAAEPSSHPRAPAAWTRSAMLAPAKPRPPARTVRSQLYNFDVLTTIKFTPDLTGDRSFQADGTVDRVSVPGWLSELDEHAAEQALQVKESGDWELTYLTMGPDGAQDALRKAL